MINFQFRDLNTSLGRWLEQDPAGYVDGANVYQLEGSSPSDHLDGHGLSWGSFWSGVADGLETGIEAGVVLGALAIAAPAIGGALAVAGAVYAGVALGEAIAGQDLSGNQLNDYQRGNLVGNVVGGFVGGAAVGAGGPGEGGGEGPGEGPGGEGGDGQGGEPDGGEPESDDGEDDETPGNQSGPTETSPEGGDSSDPNGGEDSNPGDGDGGDNGGGENSDDPNGGNQDPDNGDPDNGNQNPDNGDPDNGDNGAPQDNGDSNGDSQCNNDNGNCFIAGTKVRLGGGILTAIETIRIGQRVSAYADERVGPSVDPEKYRVIRLQLVQEGREIMISYLRPAKILDGLSPGDTIQIDLMELEARGRARILGIDPCPEIESGPGQLVTAVLESDGIHLTRLKLAGFDQPIGTTSNHPIYSENRMAFVPLSQLHEGDRVRTRSGSTTIESIKPMPGRHRVYNMEIGSVHQYYVGDALLLVHNSCNGTTQNQTTPWNIQDGAVSKFQSGDHTYFENPADGTWWSKDTAGHGGSGFKVYQATAKGLRWIADADGFGNYIIGKHKGPTGVFIPW